MTVLSFLSECVLFVYRKRFSVQEESNTVEIFSVVQASQPWFLKSALFIDLLKLSVGGGVYNIFCIYTYCTETSHGESFNKTEKVFLIPALFKEMNTYK